MTDKDWEDWHVVEEKRDERERKLKRYGELLDVGIWTKFVLLVLSSPYLLLYVVYRTSYYVSLPIVWVCLGIIFDPWKTYTKPVARVVGIGSVIGAVIAFLTFLAGLV